MDKWASVWGPLLVKIKLPPKFLGGERIERTAAEDVRLRHPRRLDRVETGAAMEINGGAAVGRHRGERGEVREDGAGGLLEGGAGEVGAEQGRVTAALQEEI